MKLDRNLQRAILQELADTYPNYAHTAWKNIQNLGDLDAVVGNMLYLEDHGLIASGIGGGAVDTGKMKIRARGLDFLEDDGGLAAILGVVTVRLHDDTIKKLIEAKIQETDLPQPDKRRYLDALRELPAESTKHLAMKLIDVGLANAPAAWSAIQSALSAAS